MKTTEKFHENMTHRRDWAVKWRQGSKIVKQTLLSLAFMIMTNSQPSLLCLILSLHGEEDGRGTSPYLVVC